MVRITNVADDAANDLVTERAALQGRLDQATAAAEVCCEVGLPASDCALQLVESNLAAGHRDALVQAVHAQQRAFVERDEIRVEQAALQWQAWPQQEQLQQCHGAEIRQMAGEHAELRARAFHYEAAAEAVVQRQELDARCVSAAAEQRCEQYILAARAESAVGLAESCQSRELANAGCRGKLSS